MINERLEFEALRLAAIICSTYCVRGIYCCVAEAIKIYNKERFH